MKVVRIVLRSCLIGIFLFSGLIKLNDPVGTQLKLQEYFGVFAQDFPFMAGFWEGMIPMALVFSIGLSALEWALASALLLKFKEKTSLNLIIALLVFFGFLTFYSAYFNKVTDCGCFGEAIKLSPWTSFSKDVVLLLIAITLRWDPNLGQQQKNIWALALSSLFAIGLGWYAYWYLPPVDSLPYAIGNSIPKNMEAREPLEFEYDYKINGELQTLKTMPTDPKAEFVAMRTLNEAEARPLISDYRIWAKDDTLDYTKESFRGNQFLLILPDLSHLGSCDWEALGKRLREIEKDNVKVWILSASDPEALNAFRHEHQLGFPAFSADIKVLKTMVRSNPGFCLLQEGKVLGKWSNHQLPEIETIKNLIAARK